MTRDWDEVDREYDRAQQRAWRLEAEREDWERLTDREQGRRLAQARLDLLATTNPELHAWATTLSSRLAAHEHDHRQHEPDIEEAPDGELSMAGAARIRRGPGGLEQDERKPGYDPREFGRDDDGEREPVHHHIAWSRTG